MAVYVVGDLQGCLRPLHRLLNGVGFDPTTDKLWATGDLVNRGPESLETLRYLKSLGKSFRTVLGNHDLHLLAIYHGATYPRAKDTFEKILTAPDLDELMHWLQSQPLVLKKRGHVLVHAGIPHIWSLDEALDYAGEVEAVLQQPKKATQFFRHMYGNEPAAWSPSLSGNTRLRVITNYLTRMRFVSREGKLELQSKSSPDSPPRGYKPWFSFPRQVKKPIIFGHWAALMGKSCGKNLYPLDTGFVWGNHMRLMELESHKYYHSL